jgi:F0F1-type ATP synthase epsilon subunit
MTTKPSLTLQVLTPEGFVLEADQLSSVKVPLVDGGTIGIRPAHAPLIAETVQGEVTYRSQEESNAIELHAGVLDIDNDVVTILTAGEVTGTPSKIAEEPETEYERLMQTLIDHLYPEKEAIGDQKL